MTILEHWENQRPLLEQELNQLDSLSDAADAIRHTLRQTEQNALAEIKDHQLRQQASILFGCTRQSISLLETQNAAAVWTAQKAKPRKPFSLCWILLGALIVLLSVYCHFKGWTTGFLIAAGAFISAAAAFVNERKRPSALPQDDFRVTIRPNTDTLLTKLDLQMHSIDRCLTDFLALNSQLRSSAETADPAAVALAADLMEALYENGGQSEAEDAARRLLLCLGLQALEYSSETSALFSTLPSKNTTQTLCPAIVSVQDQRLLRRGTAVVRTEAA